MTDWTDTHPDTPEPKHYTRRDLTAPSDGARIAKVGEIMGKPLMPWQRYVVDVATEHNPDGGYRYEIVLVTVPRQSGKTTLVGPVQVDRNMMNPGIKTFYTAQTGKDARSRFNDLVNLVQGSPFAAVAKVRYSAGDEGIGFPNGSWLKLFAPVAAALHGETPPLVTLDEIWHYDEQLGDAILEGAIIPAQMTLAGRRQVWLISTAGTAASTFMRKWVERGRKGQPGLAYFEWSLADDADPYDPDAIAAFHPAVGHTVSVDELLALASSMTHANWLRGFCNVWTEASEALMTTEEWAELEAMPLEVPARSAVTISYDVAPDNESASVMASWRDIDGSPVIRTLHTAPGIVWLEPFVKQLAADWKPAHLAADDGGPTRRITDSLERAGLVIDKVSGRDYATACDAFLTYAMDEKTLKHDGSRTLSSAMAHLAVVDRGDSRYISRSRSTGPVAGIIAGVVGLWIADHADAPMPRPFIYA